MNQQNLSVPYPNLTKLFKPKEFTKHITKAAIITKWVEVTQIEVFNKIQEELKLNHRKEGDEEACPICMCELYDDLQKKPLPDIE